MRQSTPDNRSRFACRCIVMRRFSAVAIASLMLVVTVACSPGDNNAQAGVAQFGETGAQFARKLARLCPERVPYSDQESRAADLIMEELRLYGYTPEKQEFSVTDDTGVRRTSANIIAKLEGDGFVVSPKVDESVTSTLPNQRNDLMMIVGAHYDTPAIDSVPDEPVEDEENAETQMVRPDGIHNNASGVASVLTAARVMRETPPGYDVTFVFSARARMNLREPSIICQNSRRTTENSLRSWST